MAENLSEIMNVQKPAGVPHKYKNAEPLGANEMEVLMALMDAVVPSIVRESSSSSVATSSEKDALAQVTISDEKYNAQVSHLRNNTVLFDDVSEKDLQEYLAEKPTDDPIFKSTLKGMLAHLPGETLKGLSTILYLLSTRAGSLVVTGYKTPLTQLPISDRTAIINAWSKSSLYAIRGLSRQITVLGKVIFTATNPKWAKMAGFPGTPAGWKPPKGYEYDFMQFPAASESEKDQPIEIETDVVIVGSGCGAGVCAKNIAEAGYRVVVVDKSYHFDASSFPMAAGEALFNLIEGGATVGSDDGSIAVTAGACFGGGGTINWSASLQPQGFVRDEWANELGLDFFQTQEFQNCLDKVCEQMGVHESFTPNHGNQILLDGARKLGWSAKKVPQNTGKREHSCGHCAMGCAMGEKQGPVNCWFPDAAKAGAKFIEGYKVKKVLFDDTGKNVAVGVTGTWASRGKDKGVDAAEADKIFREVVVKAKKVIVSSGTLWSPVVLKNSGLTNPWIGKNLHLHPVNVLHGFFKHDVRPWEGGILTTVVNTFENQDNKGHGVKLEALSMMPCFALQFLNWSDGTDFKFRALKYRHLNSYISIVRDRDSGSVFPDPITGQPRIKYTPSPFDRNHAMIGLVALAKILYLQGAAEIHAGLPGMRPFIREEEEPATNAHATHYSPHDDVDIVTSVADAGIADAKFKQWLSDLEKHGNRCPESVFASAHQMGTCRMSSSEKNGVIDPRGRVWSTENLYVSDASTFPSASGVNPMVTNMAISEWISRNVVKDLQAGGTQNGKVEQIKVPHAYS